MSKLIQHVIKILIFALFLFIWHASSQRQGMSALLLPSPLAVYKNLSTILLNGFLFPHIKQTIFEVIAGLLIGGIGGFLVGIILGEFQIIKELFLPYVVATQLIPKLALAPLFILWLGFGALPAIVMTSLICFFPILENTITAMEQVDPLKIQLFKVLNASPLQTLLHLKIPQGAPMILSGLKVSLVLSWVGAIVSEFMGSNVGLGALIIVGQGSMNTELIFSCLITITLIGWGMYFLLICFENWYLLNYPN